MLHSGDDAPPPMPWAYDLIRDLYTPPIPLQSIRPGEQGGYVFYTHFIPEKYEMPLPAEGWHINSFLLDAMKVVNHAIEVFTAFKNDPVKFSANKEYTKFYDDLVE